MFNRQPTEGDQKVSGVNLTQSPTISLPKGGGAIRGIGEKFSANPVTGTGSLSVPVYTSPGRAGFGPQISLSYDSGAGNGPFGFGWNISLPSITRKTDKGLPQYLDAYESDIFILSGAEDLVPVLVKDENRWVPETTSRTINGASYRIQRYRPRIEGLFTRIERWTNRADPGDTYWRSISKDNITTWYGKTDNGRITDPLDPTRVFSWLICECYDDKGNISVYHYKEEDSINVDFSQAHEKNRTDSTRSANRYLKSIRYGNRAPYYPVLAEDLPPTPPPGDWLFEVVFDYGEHHPDIPTPGDTAHWTLRHDPFSSYRAGFEIRTYRLCRRILMFHHFPEEEVGANCLVRSTDFTYSGNSIFSYLISVTQTGYKRKTDNTYLHKSLPPLEFEYSQAVISNEIKEVDPESLENLPYGLDGTCYRWVDLNGEGLSGILTEQGNGWFYKRNLSPINVCQEDGPKAPTARFSPAEPVREKPSLASLNAGRQQFLDLSGDGRLDLVEFQGPTPGFYERTPDEGWETFTQFTTLPVIDWNNPNLKFIDLTGDGHADIIVSEDQIFCWYPSLGEEGFGPPETVRMAFDEEKGPRLVFTDGTQSIYLADMSGDGLTDLVLIRNGEVCYWPNLGYGRFGSKVTMDHAPWLDTPDLFNQRRILLADIDGSGVTDIVYLGSKGVQLYFNQSGNCWSDPTNLTCVPPTDSVKNVTVVDLLGNGTACLVWSSPLPDDNRQPMLYIDLMGERKPHLLLAMKNNLGAETQITYTPSTRFYLADKLAGKPWITKLPFPVYVVERVETFDHISRNRFVTRYAYHHGYFDGIEREFRGFGMVEQWDTEAFAALSDSNYFPTGDNIETASHVPPVLTKTWFHTGVFLEAERISRQFAFEYQGAPVRTDPLFEQKWKDFAATLLPDTILPPDLGTDEVQEACRALKGSILRQEIYALDGTHKEIHPYSVSERSYNLKCLQTQGNNRHGVFLTHLRETINYHYERNPADPRVDHTLILEVDEFNNVLKSAAIGYGRHQADPTLEERDQVKQTQTLITYTENGYTNHTDDNDAYRTPLLCEARTFELTGMNLPTDRRRFYFSEVLNAGAIASSIDYEQSLTPGLLQKRLIEHVRTIYRHNNMAGPLPLGQVQSLALPFESYKLAFTPGLVSGVYGGRLNDGILETDGHYVHSEDDSNWWIPSGQVFYSPQNDDSFPQELTWASQHFFLPHRLRNPFGQTSTITYDRYDLLIQDTCDTLGNRFTAGERNAAGSLTIPGNDYRVLLPHLMMDPNRNRSAVAFDILGMVVGMAIMGKPEENLGDSLDGFDPDLTNADIATHLHNPLANPHGILQKATVGLVYDLFSYQRTKGDSQPQPTVVYSLARETHNAELESGQQTRIQHSFTYSDGYGREIQKKIQAEPGPLVKDGPEINPRWVGSGWTIFNNKGRPVRQYEPFFSATHSFEFAKVIGVSPVVFYDPADRVIATLHPNHTYGKVVFCPWQQVAWDINDTVLLDARTDADVQGFTEKYFSTLSSQPGGWQTWYQQRQGGAMGLNEQSAANKAAAHANTPTVTYFDTLGRPFLTIKNNGPDGNNFPQLYRTNVNLDIEGNQREVIDAKDRIVMYYDYDVLGNCIHHAGMEAGERWVLNDVSGNPVYVWDSRGLTLRTVYDALRRPTEVYLREGAGPELLVERTVYGETQPNPEEGNLRLEVVRILDGAGVVTKDNYDFKGNLLRSSRQLAVEYKQILDWSEEVALEERIYTHQTGYDALNRPVTLTTPDNTEIRPTYNEDNLLERIEAQLRGAEAITTFVNDIEYNAKGQRTTIKYGNGVSTEYNYDPQTFSLTHLITRRSATAFPDDCPGPALSWPGCEVQNLHYTYDPVGNITHIRDDAQQSVFFRNRRVEPGSEYTYDSVYRLIKATGREHLGQTGGQPDPPTAPGPFNRFHTRLVHSGDGNAMGTYVEEYVYDAVGNILAMQHRGANPAHPGWTRAYAYKETSQIEADKVNNRLSSTTIGTTTENYSYDGPSGLHGNITAMPHLPLMRWNYRDQLQATSQQQMNSGGIPETTYYIYDADGRRVRKITERSLTAAEVAAGKKPTRMKERIYLSGLEIYSQYENGGTSVQLERETLHIMDDQQRIALIETRTQGNDPSPPQLIRYQFGNHLGSAGLELDHQAQVISYEEYYPYGSTSYQAVRNQTETPKRYRYTGKERDEESGFYYHGSRYYAPFLGRWCSVDPIDIEDSINVYVYVNCNPIKLLDNNGLYSEIPKWLDSQIESQEKQINAQQKKLEQLKTEHKEKESQKSELTAQKKSKDSEIKTVLKHRRALESKKKLTKTEKAELKKFKKQYNHLLSESRELGRKISRIERELTQVQGKITKVERKIGTLQERYNKLTDLKTNLNQAYTTATSHHAQNNVETLTDVVMNEARSEGKLAMKSIAYAYVNRKGGQVKQPKATGDISYFRNADTRFKSLRNTHEKEEYIGNLIDALGVVDERLSDMSNKNDITQGATHWVSPQHLTTMPSWTAKLQKIVVDGINERVFTFYK